MGSAGIPVAIASGFLGGVVVQAFEDLESCVYGVFNACQAAGGRQVNVTANPAL